MSLKLNKTTYYLKDVAVVQSPISYQLHRADVNPFTTTCGRKTLPIFVAPMASVTDENNYKIWIENKVTPVVPRSVMVRLNIKQRLEIAKTTFVSISLQEAKMLYEKNVFDDFKDKILYICIDIAHGTLSSLFKICYKIKTKYDNIVIMSGNIANPDAYINYCRHGIDYVRCSIGSGSRCVCKGTKITMADGSLQNIEDISKGEYVLTTNGAQKVINTFSKKTTSTIEINGKIKCTPNHKFFVIKKSLLPENKDEINDDFIKNNGEYIEASNLNSDYLLVEG